MRLHKQTLLIQPLSSTFQQFPPCISQSLSPSLLPLEVRTLFPLSSHFSTIYRFVKMVYNSNCFFEFSPLFCEAPVHIKFVCLFSCQFNSQVPVTKLRIVKKFPPSPPATVERTDMWHGIEKGKIFIPLIKTCLCGEWNLFCCCYQLFYNLPYFKMQI